MIRIVRHRRPAAALAAVVAIVALAVPAAHGHAPDPLLAGGLYPQNAVVRWTWQAGEVPPAWMQPAIQNGANASGHTTQAKAPTFHRDAAGKGRIEYGLDVVCGVSGLACARRILPDSFLIGFREQGHRFDWGQLRWCQFFAAPPDGCYDVEHVTLHEFGHVHVLNHHVNHQDQRDYLDAIVQTVARAKPRAGWNARAFARCDVATLQREYGLRSASTLVSTCLNLATTVTLSASSTSIPYRGTVRLTANLRVNTNAAYRRLSSQVLAGRTVTLQTKAPSSTIWTTIGPMTPGTTAGSYSLDRTLMGTADFRVVFSAPSNEGLGASASSTVRVNVGPCTIPPCPK